MSHKISVRSVVNDTSVWGRYQGGALRKLATNTRVKEEAGRRARTDDLLITNQLLYQLSYAGT